jgi:hypothetical protein
VPTYTSEISRNVADDIHPEAAQYETLVEAPLDLEPLILTDGPAFSGYCACRQSALYEASLPSDVAF